MGAAHLSSATGGSISGLCNRRPRFALHTGKDVNYRQLLNREVQGRKALRPYRKHRADATQEKRHTMQRTQKKRAAKSRQRGAAPGWPMTVMALGSLVSLAGFTQPWVQVSSIDLETAANLANLGIATPEPTIQPMSGLELLKSAPLLVITLVVILISVFLAWRAALRRQTDAESSLWQAILAVVAAATVAISQFALHFGVEVSGYWQYGYFVPAVGLLALIAGGVAGFK